MTNTPHDPKIDLQEAATRNRTARQHIASLAIATSVEVWEHIQAALADSPALSAEISRLRTSLNGVRLDRANLAAAALATLSAHHDGEPDPLSYLRDELSAQGYDPGGRA